jgi:hypothetical protein
MTHDERAIAAASNNADLYEAVFQSWGLRYQRLPFAFIGRDQPPPYYSNLTVLSANCRRQIMSELEALAKRFHGLVCFKDSFCEFELQAYGFELLFTGSWIWRASASDPFPVGWSKIDSPHDLKKWELAWNRSGSHTRERMFRASLLQLPDIVFLGKMQAGGFACGCIANVSSDCIGISNLFSNFCKQAAFVEATSAVASLQPRLPIVGYAAEPRLVAAQLAGFERVGDMRVLTARDARF